ncbi:MAG: hypothetical protein M3Z41_04150 [Candidatus Eremiobacteraeota bacterium]|nr:hypothetical protein [Candidatus Eremiobacteraeota bacterium]
MSDTSSLFEFVEPDGTARWIATPGKQTTFPLSIRNETAEGHQVAVLVEDPANWAWADPQRVSLDPGHSATVSIVFAPNKETSIAAGVHQAAIRLRDLEGVIFAECIRPFEVEERQELAMTVTLRGPLMSFGMAEGFVLHCTLANRGNIDVTARPVGEPHPTLTFSERAVSVPFRGEVAFDIEVRWNAARRNHHPDIVTLRAPYNGGEAKASIEWRYIAEALEPFMPIYSTAEEDDEFLSLSWLPQPGEDVLDHRLPKIPADEAAAEADVAGVGSTAAASAATTALQPAASPAARQAPPVPEELLAARRAAAKKPGKRISPWWPVIQVLGGKWRVKPLPIMMLIISVEGFIIGMTQAQRDYYASPELRQPVPRVARALQMGTHAAQMIVGGAEHAISATLSAGSRLEHSIHFGRRHASAASTIPTLWGLAARYLNPRTLAVSYNETGCSALRLLVASGPNVIFNKAVSSQQLTVPIPQNLSDPLRITVVGTAPGGIELRQHVFMALPFAQRAAAN